MRRDASANLARLLRRLFKALLDDGGRIRTFERRHARERMVKCRAQAIHIRAIINDFLAHLLRRDVIRRAPNLVGVLLHASKTEVHNLRIAIRIEKNVLRLDVAMHKPLVRGTTQGLRNLLAKLDNARNVRLARRVLHELLKRTARDKFHRNIRHAI